LWAVPVVVRALGRKYENDTRRAHTVSEVVNQCG
jgi:hypothetical protein